MGIHIVKPARLRRAAHTRYRPTAWRARRTNRTADGHTDDRGRDDPFTNRPRRAEPGIYAAPLRDPPPDYDHQFFHRCIAYVVERLTATLMTATAADADARQHPKHGPAGRSCKRSTNADSGSP